MDPIIASLLLRSAVLFLMVGSIAGLVVGALLIRSPQRLRVIGNLLNRWVSTRHIDQALERSINVDPWFYRHRRISGGLILLASVYILYALTFNLDRANVIIGLSLRFSLHQALVGGLLDALVLSTLLGALLAVFVGLFLLLRPSSLRDFEQVSNRWVSMRRALKPMEVRREAVDEYLSGIAARPASC